MSGAPMERTEFGAKRTSCACYECQTYCRHMPGFLLPADLERLLPESEILPYSWAERNLLASPGALAVKNGVTFRIPTLVPAVKSDGSCIHFSAGRCAIHAAAPFGCAFFDCGPDPRDEVSNQGLVTLIKTPKDSLYYRIWDYLDARGLRQEHANVLRERIKNDLRKKENNR